MCKIEFEENENLEILVFKVLENGGNNFLGRIDKAGDKFFPDQFAFFDKQSLLEIYEKLKSSTTS